MDEGTTFVGVLLKRSAGDVSEEAPNRFAPNRSLDPA